MQNEKQHGRVEVLLEQYLREHNISKTKAANRANMIRTRFNAYCRNDIQRVDLDVLARLCNALDCEVGDLLRYVPGDA